MNNPVLSEIYRTGQITLPSGQIVPADANGMPQAQAERLYDLVRHERPQLTLEVGLAVGLSTMCICQALIDTGTGRHIAMDPFQTRYDEAGLRHLERAGLRNLVEFHEESSHRVLPQLEAANTRVDFAFIDGGHLFDFTLLEFFYIDRMLKVGGLIAFDDMWMPAVRKVVRYAVSNRDYREESGYPNAGVARNTQRRIKRLTRGLKTIPKAIGFALAGEREELLVNEIAWSRDHHMAVLRKVKDDDRDWRHHVDF